MYEIAAARSSAQGAARVVARAGRMLLDAGERIDGLSSQAVLRRFVALEESLDGREALPRAARPVPARASRLAPLQERLGAIDCSGATSSIQSPGDLVGKASQILTGARREGRDWLTPNELIRFNRLAMLAEAPGLQRAAARRLKNGPNHPQRPYGAEAMGA